MTIKNQGGVFGRNPTFNNVDAATADLSGNLTVGGTASVGNTRIASGSITTTSGALTLNSATNVVDSTSVLRTTSALSVLSGRQWDLYAQGGVFKVRDSSAFIVRAEFDLSGNVKINNGNLQMGTAGTGIDFSATSGTGTSELFNDYEEGTWTPTLTTDATDFTSVTYDGLTSGVYTKIGNVVQISGTLRTDAITVGSASGTVLIGGLPFTAAAPTAVAVGSSSAWNVNHPNAGEVRSGTTALALLYRALANGAATNVAPADCRTTGDSNLLRFSAVYRT